jgi:hypothetical protein
LLRVSSTEQCGKSVSGAIYHVEEYQEIYLLLAILQEADITGTRKCIFGNFTLLVLKWKKKS